MSKSCRTLPTVSVIIPTYNRAHLVGRAIRSVLAQTFQDFEIIVVDDASTDNTEEVIRAFGDPRIIFLHQETNRGPSAARNTGIRASRGEYIAFLDSDDGWLPRKLEKQLDMFRTSPLDNLGLLLSGIRMIQDGRVLAEKRAEAPLGGWQYEDALSKRVIPPSCSTWLLKRSVLSPIPFFDESFTCGEDHEYLVRASRICRIGSVPEALVVWHGDNTDHVWHGNPKNTLKGQLRFLEKYAPELAERPRLRSRHHRRLARLYYQLSDMPRVRKHLARAICAHPLNIRLYPWFVAVHFGSLGYRFVFRFSRALPLLRDRNHKG